MSDSDQPKKPKFGLNIPWLHHDTPDEAAAKEAQKLAKIELERRVTQVREAEMRRQSSDMAELQRGGIPIQAVNRLKEIGESSGSIFTSDLAPEEAALLRREGYRPLGLVTGSAMYHVGQAYASATNDCEVRVLSEAYDQACWLAVRRLRIELDHIGAHGVVGVRITMMRHEWADKTIEVQVIGTAVQGSGSKPKNPWLCDLSGQEWWALHRAGYEPAGLVWGHASWFILTTYNDEWNITSWQNVEMAHWSAALSHARRIAMKTIHEQASQHGACGVGGVRIDRRMDEVRLTGGEGDVYEREHHNLVLAIFGTAIRPRPGAPSTVRATQHVLSLREGRLSPVAIDARDVKIE